MAMSLLVVSYSSWSIGRNTTTGDMRGTSMSQRETTTGGRRRECRNTLGYTLPSVSVCVCVRACVRVCVQAGARCVLACQWHESGPMLCIYIFFPLCLRLCVNRSRLHQRRLPYLSQPSHIPVRYDVLSPLAWCTSLCVRIHSL